MFAKDPVHRSTKEGVGGEGNIGGMESEKLNSENRSSRVVMDLPDRKRCGERHHFREDPVGRESKC